MKNCYYSSTDRMTSDRQSDVGEFNWKRAVVNVDLMTSKSYFFLSFQPFATLLHSNIGMDSSSSGGENVKILYIIFPQHFPLYSTNRIYFKLHSENFCCFNSGIVFALLLCNADGGILYCIDEIVECKIWDAHLLDCWSFIMKQELSTFIHSFFFCQTSKCSWSS